LLRARTDASAGEFIVCVSGRDRWHENDQLVLRRPPPRELERWWIGRSPPSSGWRHVAPESAPFDVTDYLAAGVVVLNDVSADELDAPQRQALEQYVRHLGGGVVMLGGEHSFAAGGYAGTAMERMSPLAINPPAPTTHWMLLADSSGSMGSRLGDTTRWKFATTAIAELVPMLPPSDPLTLGNFAADVNLWQRGEPVSEANLNILVPAGIRPTGPTNLGPALREIARIADPSVPSQLVLVTDAEAELLDAEQLRDALVNARVKVHALTTQSLGPNHPLRMLIDATGGRLVAQEDPRRWASELYQLLRGAAKPWLMREPVMCRFTQAGPDLPPQRAELWNRAWLKPAATLLAEGAEGERPPLAAAWNLGAGAVIACAFNPPAEVAEVLANRAALPPRDPRFTVTWNVGSEVRVTIDAQERGNHVNDLYLALNLLSPRLMRRSHPIPQIAPGRYELTVPAAPQARLGVVQLNEHLLDRRALPSRYPPEFDAVGVNMQTLTELAKRTGGELIAPTRVTPIEFPRVPDRVPLAPLLAAGGAAFVAAGLIRWRLA
jgi:hypothetical protein